MNERIRVAVLISGRGSNMMSLAEAARAPDYPAAIAAVISNRPDAGGLHYAAEQGIAAELVDHRAFGGKPAFEAALHAAIERSGADLVCLAGFMRLLSAEFVARWEGRALNIHPALLPAFRGLDTHARALAEGVRLHGCTVHFLSAETDAGPIVAQAAVPVLEDDDPQTLGRRVLAAEHRLYPHALALVASGAARLESGRVVFREEQAEQSALFSPGLPPS
jgi:phosphoribosylglycinamide formyltransferase 1